MSGAPRIEHNGAQATAWMTDRELILTRYRDLLEQASSPLIANEHLVEEVTKQLYSVVDSVAAAIGERNPKAGLGSGELSLSTTIGANRAIAGIHPAQSLQAAALIFEAALPIFARRLAAAGKPSPELTAGRMINRAILDRMATAARAYVDYLLTTAHGHNNDERRRLSRELHDVAAPAIAVGLQNLELYELYALADPDKARLKFAAAKESMRDALATIRGLSAQSRDSVGDRGLRNALSHYLGTVPTDIQTDLSVRGDLEDLPLAYCEELFLIVREAVRNAIDHGSPKRIAITLTMAGAELHTSVHDDGSGFDVDRVLVGDRHVGIDSMGERAALLGAQLTITSAPRVGTDVSVRISTPGGFTPSARRSR